MRSKDPGKWVVWSDTPELRLRGRETWGSRCYLPHLRFAVSRDWKRLEIRSKQTDDSRISMRFRSRFYGKGVPAEETKDRPESVNVQRRRPRHYDLDRYRPRQRGSDFRGSPKVVVVNRPFCPIICQRAYDVTRKLRSVPVARSIQSKVGPRRRQGTL